LARTSSTVAQGVAGGGLFGDGAGGGIKNQARHARGVAHPERTMPQTKHRDAVDANHPTDEMLANDARSRPERTGAGAEAWLGPSLFVWSVWALMTVAGLAFVHLYGTNIPFQDEFDAIAPALTGNEPFNLQYLWKQHNEHRFPAGKLIIWLLYRASGDLRATMYFSVLALSAAAAFLVRTASKLRGRPTYLDAFFPVVLLHWGHFASMLFAIQVSFVLAVLFTCLALGIVVVSRNRLEPRAALAGAACLVGLTLSGASGLALVLPLGVWLAYAAIQTGWSSGKRARWDRVWIGLLALLPFALAGAFFYDHHRLASSKPPPGVGAALLTACQFLTVSLGHPVVQLWLYALVAILTATAAVVACLLRACRRGEGRCGAAGFLAFLAGMAILSGGIGWNRAGFGPYEGFQWRYVTLSAPLLCGLYLAWEAYGPRRLGQLLPACLFTAVCIFFWPNFESGHEMGEGLRELMVTLEHDIRAGVPASVLAQRSTWLFPNPEMLEKRFEMLQRAGWGNFRYLRIDHNTGSDNASPTH
jgi:hypothetical protein